MVKFCKALNTWRALDTVGMATTIAVSGCSEWDSHPVTDPLAPWLPRGQTDSGVRQGAFPSVMRQGILGTSVPRGPAELSWVVAPDAGNRTGHLEGQRPWRRCVSQGEEGH